MAPTRLGWCDGVRPGGSDTYATSTCRHRLAWSRLIASGLIIAALALARWRTERWRVHTSNVRRIAAQRPADQRQACGAERLGQRPSGHGIERKTGRNQGEQEEVHGGGFRKRAPRA